MTRARLTAVAMAGIVALASVSAGAPSQASAEDSPSAIRVLALGDSYTAGVGGGDYYDEACMRSTHSWVEEWAQIQRQRGRSVDVENGACSGAKTGSFYAPETGNRKQLDYVDSSYDIVFVTIGGNDIGFGEVAYSCLIGLDLECEKQWNKSREQFQSSAEPKDYGTGEPRTIAGAISDVLFDIGKKLHSGAKIVYLGYPSIARHASQSSPFYCANVSCTVNASDFGLAAGSMHDRQWEAVVDANARLSADPEVAGVSVVSALDAPLEFSDKAPLIGALPSVRIRQHSSATIM